MSATSRLRLACAVTAAVSAAALGLSGASPVAASPSPGRPAAASSAGRLTALASTGRPAPGHSALRGAGGSAAAGDVRSACASQAQAACTALLRADRPDRAGVQQAATSLPGYSPADLQSAYNLIAAAAADGNDATIAVIGAYDDPDAESDLGVYRAQYGLPPCTSADGCFTKLDENGQASPLPPASDNAGGYGAIEAIDLDMVSAVCPNCDIDLLEANTTDEQDLGTTVDSAVSLGARYVVIGWTSPNGGYDAVDGKYFDHPGVAITVPAGDNGFSGFCCGSGDYYPTASQYVTAVGGTTLLPAANARGWSESVWGPSDENDYRGTGSGCSRLEGKPSWQTDTGCAGRTYNDVAAVADPNPGVSVYDTDSLGGWAVAGGTTVSAAIVGAVYALAGPPTAGTYPSSYPWLHSADLNDVTSGNNADGACTPSYLCTAGPGYDGPSGWGTPDGTSAFALGSVTGNLISVIGPGTQKDTAPEAVNVPVEAVDTDAGQTLTYSAAGLPPGVSIDSSTGVISGTTSALYSGNATVTVTDGTGAHASVTSPWTVINDVTYINPGRQQTEPDTAVTLKVAAEDSNRSQTLTYSATGLPAGLSIDSSTGEVTGTTEGIAPYEVTVTATDTVGATASVSFTWSVQNLITVTIGVVNDYELYAGQAVSIPVTATDSGGNLPLTFTATGLPPGLSIDAATGQISGTPTTVGVYFIMVTATDPTGSADPGYQDEYVIGSITLANPGSQADQVGSAAAVYLDLTDSGLGDTLKFTVTGLPPGVTFDAARQVLTGYPTTQGAYTVTVTVTGFFSANATVSFTWTVARRGYHWPARAPQAR